MDVEISSTLFIPAISYINKPSLHRTTNNRTNRLTISLSLTHTIQVKRRSSIMAINDPIHYLPATIALLILASILVFTHSAPPPPEKACSDEVIAFAPCLPYTSNPPNNQTKSPSSQCCDLFASAFDSGTANCLCYLLRDSHLLGFPLNRTRFLSLSSLCVPKDNSGSNRKQTLESLCSGLIRT